MKNARDPMMSLYALALCFLVGSVSAQDPERIYLSSVLEHTSQRKATYYLQLEGEAEGRFIGRTYTMDGTLKIDGKYLDEALSIEHGMFVFYHPNGKIESAGLYTNGLKAGVWNRFDQWGRELAEKVYDPEPLADIVYSRAETMPQYPGGTNALVHYLKDQMTQPDGDRLRGHITTSFIVEKDGQLSEVMVVKGKDQETNDQVVEALKRSPRWEPGTEKGQPVRVQMRVPVQF